MKYLFFVALAATTLVATDATGTWTGTLTPTDGQSHPARLVLKQDGEKLTGTAGPDENEQRPIQNGSVRDGVLTFELPNDGSVMKFTLKQEGDAISGDVTRDHDGETQKAKLAVKRAE
jgi:hypothetical protein